MAVISRELANDIDIKISDKQPRSREIMENISRHTFYASEFGQVEDFLYKLNPDITLCDMDGVVLNMKAQVLGIKPSHLISSLFGHEQKFFNRRAISFVSNLTKKGAIFITNRTRFTEEAKFWRTEELYRELKETNPTFELIDGLDRQTGEMRILSRKGSWERLEKELDNKVLQFKFENPGIHKLKISIISDEFFDIADLVQPIYKKVKQIYRLFNSALYKISPHSAENLAFATHSLKENLKHLMNIETLSEPPIGDFRFVSEVKRYISDIHKIEPQNIQISMIRISMTAKFTEALTSLIHSSEKKLNSEG